MVAFIQEPLREWLTRLEAEVDALDPENSDSQSYFAEATTDLTTASSSLSDMTGVTLSPVLNTGDILIVHWSVAAFNSTGVVIVNLLINGVNVQGGSTPTNGSGVVSGVFRISGLAAGARVCKLQWRTGGTGTATCSAGTDANNIHHANILVERVRT